MIHAALSFKIRLHWFRLLSHSQGEGRRDRVVHHPPPTTPVNLYRVIVANSNAAFRAVFLLISLSVSHSLSSERKCE